MKVTRRPGTRFLPSTSEGFLRVLSCAMKGACLFANDLKTVACIKPQYAENLGLQIISRSQQGPMSSPSQCRSACQHPTAANRGNASKSDPSRSARARYGRHRMFQQCRPHLEAILTPACGVGAASPLIAAQQSLASIALEPPRQPLRPSPTKSRVWMQEHVNWGDR
jgi:hypothetical protein